MRLRLHYPGYLIRLQKEQIKAKNSKLQKFKTLKKFKEQIKAKTSKIQKMSKCARISSIV